MASVRWPLLGRPLQSIGQRLHEFLVCARRHKSSAWSCEPEKVPSSYLVALALVAQMDRQTDRQMCLQANAAVKSLSKRAFKCPRPFNIENV